MRRSILLRLGFGAAALVLLCANIPTVGRFEWVETNPRPISFDGGCHPLQFRGVKLDGGTWTNGAVYVEVDAGPQLQLRDSTCQSSGPISLVLTNSSGQGTLYVRPVNYDGGTLADTVSISEADSAGPWPYPVQYGPALPTKIVAGPQSWSAPTSTCRTAYVAHTDATGNPRIPLASSTTVSLLVTPLNGDLVIYLDEFCMTPATYAVNGSARQYNFTAFGPYARFAFSGMTSQTYAVTVTSTASSGQQLSSPIYIFSSMPLGPAYAIFDSSPQTVPAGQCSALGTISARDLNGALSDSDGTFGVIFDAPTHMTFYDDDTCTNALPIQNGRHELYFPLGTSTASFAFKTTVLGQHMVSLSPGNAPASLQTETIVASQTPALLASVSPTSLTTCNAAQVTLRNQAPDGGTASYSEFVKVCVNDLSAAQIVQSSLTGGGNDGGTRCTEGFFSTTADVKIKATVPTEATVTVSSPRSVAQLPKVTWSAGPPDPRRSKLTINSGSFVQLAPGQVAKAQLSLKDSCGGPADVTGRTVTFEGSPALQFDPVSIQSSVATSNVTLLTCEGVDSTGVAVRALVDGVPVEDTPGAVQEVLVKGDCTLAEPLVSVALSPSERSAVFGSKILFTADIARLTPAASGLRLRLTGSGVELVTADGARSSTRDVDLELGDGTNRVTVEGVLSGSGGSTATVVATPIDALSRTAGEASRADVEITPLPPVDLGCTAGGGAPLLLLALGALLSRTVRRVA